MSTIDILITVKRYSFNPLYNPYILIIYTPLNEKRLVSPVVFLFPAIISNPVNVICG
jgi:hypothetical protein